MAVIFAETLREELATGNWGNLTWGFKDVVKALKSNTPQKITL